jgi:hypothetical protein
MIAAKRSGRRWALAALGAAAAAALAVALPLGCSREGPPPPAEPPAVTGDVTAQVHEFCGACHAYPPADTFPRSAWKGEVERGYMFFEQSQRPLLAPPIEAVVKYYEDRAPLELPLPKLERSPRPFGARFEKTDFPPPVPGRMNISNVNLVYLTDPRRPDVLACDMGTSANEGRVMLLRPTDPSPAWRVLAPVSHPGHAEVVDLDGDGIKDVLVANLGSFEPTDRKSGSVVWLRGRPDGGYTPITLLEGVGRVADVQAADFRGTGKLDLVVAAFGWNTTGEILFLENQTTDWSKPKFVKHVLDDRHGTIHVPVTDLDGDGRPDFVALISQEHETVVAFMNEGGGKFRKQTLYAASHPGYGSSGIQLVDFNKDGKVDVLYTNGDVLDQPYLLKPYHSIQWLENKGGLKFEHHHLATMYGTHRAVAADLDGDGDLDVLAVSFLPEMGFPQRKQLDLDAVVILEQTAPGKFVRHVLETGSCDHVSCAAGDLYGTGRNDLVIGTFGATAAGNPVTIWKNLGKR